MSKEVDITGRVFGRLTAIKKIDNKHWLFRCSCGKEKKIKKTSVVRGITKSCGCLWYEDVACGNKTHGMSESRLYGCWLDMKHRCYLKTRCDYHRYGGRGIKVCDTWKNSFESFMTWALANGYTDSLTLDRIDVNGDYCPENCRWVDRKQQAVNRRTTVFVEYKGERLCLKDWARRFNKPRYSWYNTRLKKMDKQEVLRMWDSEK